MLGLIAEINRLWKPVYPFLAQHVDEIFCRCNGNVLEVGPFCGVIFEMARKSLGTSFDIGSFPVEMSDYYAAEITAQDMTGRVRLIETDPVLSGIADNSVDLVLFRGALFFPGVFRVDYSAIERVLMKNGVAFVGGGFGKYTPSTIIGSISDRSRQLNLLIGKTEVAADRVKHDLILAGLSSKTEVVTEGGLWVVMRK